MTDTLDPLVDEQLLDLLTDDFVAQLEGDELDALLEVMLDTVTVPGRRGLQPHQLPPADFQAGEQFAWMFQAGRGSGKTMSMSEELYDHVMHGPPCDPFEPGGHRMAIVAPTLGDVASSCFLGPSGLRRIDPRFKMVSRKGGTFVIFPNGAEAKCTGGKTEDDTERLRAAGNLCRAWVEEAAAIKRLALVWRQLQFAVRMGPRPQVQMSSTPKRTTAFKRVVDSHRVTVTRARTADNVYLPESERKRLYEDHQGTRLAAQELEGELVEETPGALWTGDVVDERRILTSKLRLELPPADETREQWLRRALGLTTVFVGVDPATSGAGDRTGIVVVGGDNPAKRPSRQRDVFFLEDRTALMVPSTVDLGEALGDDKLDPNIEGWGDVLGEVAIRWAADGVVVERNRLGRTARAVIRAAGFTGRIIEIDAKGSKANRADALRQTWRRRCWIVDKLRHLEAEMTTWVPAEGDDPEFDDEADDLHEFTGSPDALDGAGHPARLLLGLEEPIVPDSGPLSDAMLAGWQSVA
jgi:phage terminase large subunit-like protein